MYKFNSRIEFGKTLPKFSEKQVKDEPMLFNCDIETAYKLGGYITQSFLNSLNEEFQKAKDFIIDTRVHMLMEDWFPCIPGFHHDDVPRERIDKQPNYTNPSYCAKHALALVGDCCPTEFALGTASFPEVPLGSKYYKIWHPIVADKLRNCELESFAAPERQIIYFNWQTWHQGTKAWKGGWRWFGRATINTGRKPTNELRRQTQVYMESPMEGW